MAFKTTLRKAILASESVHVGVGMGLLPLVGLWGDERGEEALALQLPGGDLEAHDQQIEVDDNGCAIFEDVEGIKHSISLAVPRAITEADMPADEQQEEKVPDGVLVH